LGITLLALGRRESAEGDPESAKKQMRDAIAAHRESLQEYSREQTPLDWAKTQEILGDALSSLGSLESNAKRLEQGVNAYVEARTVLTREHTPQEWTRASNSLCSALIALEEQERKKFRLDKAKAALESVRDILRETDPGTQHHWLEVRIRAIDDQVAGTSFQVDGA
jgi:tetratricopeptide (TPR) repeat protein